MQWVPQKPPSHRSRRFTLTIVAIVIALLVFGTILVGWGLIGTTQLAN